MVPPSQGVHKASVSNAAEGDSALKNANYSDRKQISDCLGQGLGTVTAWHKGTLKVMETFPILIMLIVSQGMCMSKLIKFHNLNMYTFIMSIIPE